MLCCKETEAAAKQLRKWTLLCAFKRKKGGSSSTMRRNSSTERNETVNGNSTRLIAANAKHTCKNLKSGKVYRKIRLQNCCKNISKNYTSNKISLPPTYFKNLSAMY